MGIRQCLLGKNADLPVGFRSVSAGHVGHPPRVQRRSLAENVDSTRVLRGTPLHERRVSWATLGVLFAQSILHCLNFMSVAAPPHTIGWKWCLITPSIFASTAVAGSFVACSFLVQQHVLDMYDD